MGADVENRKVEVRSANINHLVKRFANNIFKGYKVDRRTGKYLAYLRRINFDQFRDWISKHPKLYNSYFEGFHNFVWEYVDGKPLYMSRIC